MKHWPFSSFNIAHRGNNGNNIMFSMFKDGIIFNKKTTDSKQDRPESWKTNLSVTSDLHRLVLIPGVREVCCFCER